MKWKKGTAGRSNGKKKSGSSSKSKSSPGYKDSNSASGDEPSSTPTTPMDSAGALRVGIIRSNTAPFCTPTPRAKRQLISDLLEPTDVEEEDEDLKSVSASHSLRSIISNRSSLGRNFDKEVGTGGSFSSYCAEEKAAFASHLNQYLLGDSFLKHLLPLDLEGKDFFEKFSDGVLMCRLVCLAIPGSIADSTINAPSGFEPLGLYKSNENLNAALTAAEKAGLQVVNIGASDIINGRPASILGLSWQLIRVHLLSQINLKGCPDLIHLMEEGEVVEDFYKLPVEEILLRWFNHHLRWAGSERRVSNFGSDLADGKCYITLIKELNDKFDGAESDWPDEDARRSQFRRACLVISGAEGIGLAPLLRPHHINGKAHLYNVAFVAQLLNRRPRIHRESLHLGASVAMQAWFRMVSVMRRTRPLIQERRQAANTLARACRRWMHNTKRWRAAIVLQARRRGALGRLMARERRLEVEEAKAKAAAAKAAAIAAEKARLEELRRQKEEAAAATRLQAWARGIEARGGVNAALLKGGLPPLKSERRRRVKVAAETDSLGAWLKEDQVGQSVSRRTSTASSARVSEVSPGSDPLVFSFDTAPSSTSAVDASRRWFDKIFEGISFTGTRRQDKNPKRQQAAAAMVVQRWRRSLVRHRIKSEKAMKEADQRRLAVKTLHKAYSRDWRSKLAARTKVIQAWEEEARLELEKSKGWLDGLWAMILRNFSQISDELDSDEDNGPFGKAAWRRAREAIKDGDCCDAVGRDVLACEIEAWKTSYVNELVTGCSGQGEAQEARARMSSKVGVDDRAWTSPEKALSPGKFVAMSSVLITVMYEVVFLNAAAIGF